MSAPIMDPSDKSNVQLRVTQAAHGFVIGDVIYSNAGVWAKARSDAAATLPTEVVAEIVSVNVFRTAQDGELISGTGFTAGHVVHVSATTAGLAVSAAQGAVPASALYNAPIGEAMSATSFKVGVGQAALV